MKRINFGLSVVLASIYLTGYAYADAAPALESVTVNLDLDIVAVVCGPHASCPINITKGKTNAIGDTVIIDVRKLPKTSLIPEGKTAIEEEQFQWLPLPPKGGIKVYSFIPSEGELADKTIYLAFDDVVSRPGSRLGGKTFIRILRQVEGDAPDKWLEAGELEGFSRPTKWPFTLMPDGTLVTIYGKDKRRVEFKLGKKMLGS